MNARSPAAGALRATSLVTPLLLPLLAASTVGAARSPHPVPSRRSAPAPRFEVSFPASAHAGPITGRVVVVVARGAQPEPRLAISPRGPAIFGVDIDHLAPGAAAIVDDKAIGYPFSLGALPPGDYFAQAIVAVYEQVHRADGKSPWLPVNDGNIEFFSAAANNLYSDVVPVHVGTDGVVRFSASHVVPKYERPKNTEWIRQVSFQSPMLTKFWGRPIFIHASVLLPKGYDEHPDAHYPAVYTLGHGFTPLNFSTTPPRNGATGVNPATGLESGYETFRKWSGDGFPRVICISLQQMTPYFPDSYSVNSANNGPYGDAIIQEMMPFLEKTFRIIPRPYARHLEGASTSGWQSLAMQLQHPAYFGGAWIFQPDPIDFTRYQETNIYSDTNAFVVQTGPFTSAERIFQRTPDGQGLFSVRELSRFEAVLGSRGRSQYQLEAWEAIYGPVDADGYPVPLWNKLTGTIDPAVARYMRDNGYDLKAYAEKNWATIGPLVVGKLHFSAGDMDDYWLNLAVYRFEDFLRTTTNPHYEGDFQYGRPMKGHAWHYATWADLVRKIAADVERQAPAGENVAQWHY